MHLYGVTATYDVGRVAGETTLTEQWYWIVCLTLFRFLLLRWLWRICLWSYFLWRLAKLKLHLMPTHPDGVAELGGLELVHSHFTPLILAFSAVQFASLAEEIAVGATTFEAIYPLLALVLVVDAVLFVGPLCIFIPKLWVCRVKGLRDYMEFSTSYVRAFHKKWLGAAPPAEPLLGTPDLQSLADLRSDNQDERQRQSG